MKTAHQLTLAFSSSKHLDYKRQDLRKTTLWAEDDDYLNTVFAPSVDQVSSAADLAASPDGQHIAFTGSIYSSDWRTSPPKTRICMLSTSESTLETITAGPNNDRLSKWSPDGKILGFLSDRKEKESFQLYLLKSQGIGEAKPAPSVEGTVEDFHWAPDGKRILVQVVGKNPDDGGVDSSVKTGMPKDDIPIWMPSVDYGDQSEAWRSLWIYDLATHKLKRVNDTAYPWEATFCGSNAIVSIASNKPTEDAWYVANLRIKHLDSDHGKEPILYMPRRQLASPTATPSGKQIAVIEALASDRPLVFGVVVIVDLETRTARQVQDLAVDVTYIVWRDEDFLSYIGFQGTDTIARQYPASQDVPA
jgi:hypothetical protein